MTKEQFKLLTLDNIVYLDGATGSFLMAAGMPSNVCPEDWTTSHPETIIDLQRRYVEAGSEIIYAPTFGANRWRLMNYGMENEIVRINTQLVKYSKIAADGKAFVAGNLSMLGTDFVLYEEDFFEPLVNNYKQQIEILVDAGCDLLAIETMMNIREAEAAVVAANEVCNLPVLVTMTFEANQRTLYGDRPETTVKVLEAAGADSIGANCSVGPDKMVEIITEMRGATKLPLVAKPNAGIPQPGANGTVVYNLSDDDFAVQMAKLIEAGANIVGGCCGTSPEYIQKLRILGQNINFVSCR